MYTPNIIHLVNFMSHKDTFFEFNPNATMVYGSNETDDGQVSNGSGKSAILEALSLALVGNTLRKVSSKDLVRQGESSCTVNLILLDGKNELQIKRIVYSNTKSSELMIKFNGENPLDLVVNGENKIDVRDGNAWILKQLGVSREDLLNFFLISKEKYLPFLSSSDTDKKAIIDRFAQSNLVDPVFNNLKQEISDIEQEIIKLQRNESSISGKIELLNQQVEKESKLEWLTQKQNKIVELDQKIAASNHSITAINNQVLEKGELLDKIEKEISLLNNDDLIKSLQDAEDTYNKNKVNSKLDEQDKKVRAELNSYIAEFKEIQQDLTDAKELLQQNKNKLVGLIICPKCTHEFTLDKNIDVAETKNAVDQLEVLVQESADMVTQATEIGKELRKNVNDVADKIIEHDGNLTILQRKVLEIKQQLRAFDSKKEELVSNVEKQTRQIERLLEQVDDEYTRINDYKNQIKLVEAEEFSSNAPNWINQIEQLETQLSQNSVQMEQLKLQIEQTTEWQGIMKRFKAYLANKSIKAIETIANDYLIRLKTNLQLRIEGFKINRAGDVSEKISTYVLRDGVEEGLFEKFSTGEKARIDIAVILALQGLINLNSANGLDLCFLDEVADGLDSEGLLNLMNVLNTLAQPVVVISHGTMDKRVKNSIEIKKIRGISQIN